MLDAGFAGPFIRLFPEEEIPRIVQRVLETFPFLIRPASGCKRPEDNLTDQLFTRLCSCVDYRTGPVRVIPTREPSMLDEDGKKKPDVCFFSVFGIEHFFVVEAKRLFVTASKGSKHSLIQEYIDEGMMRFVSGYYARTQAAGAMLGYVFDADLATAKATLSQQIAAASAKLCLSGSWQPSTLLVDPPVDETCHALTGRRLVIYHLLAKLATTR